VPKPGLLRRGSPQPEPWMRRSGAARPMIHSAGSHRMPWSPGKGFQVVDVAGGEREVDPIGERGADREGMVRQVKIPALETVGGGRWAMRPRLRPRLPRPLACPQGMAEPRSLTHNAATAEMSSGGVPRPAELGRLVTCCAPAADRSPKLSWTSRRRASRSRATMRPTAIRGPVVVSLQCIPVPA
jgi:hypothetical protein